MTKDEDFKLLKIQNCVLRVNIDCDGCKQKVKKLLQRIEGVYRVNIDADNQRVTVSGSVDSATLIKKLVRSGKHAELWSQKSNQNNQKQKNSCIKDDNKNNKGQKQQQHQDLIKGLEAFKNQQNFQAFACEEDDDFLGDEEYDEEDALRLMQERANHLNLIRQQAANNAKNGGGGSGAGLVAMAAAPGNGKIGGNMGNGNNGKKGNLNQNVGVQGNSSGIDPKTLAALSMNNAHLGMNNAHLGMNNAHLGTNNAHLGRNNAHLGMNNAHLGMNNAHLGMNNAHLGMNSGEGRMGNDISALRGLSGLHGNNGNVAALGGNLNGVGSFQAQPNNGFQAASSGFPSTGMATGHHQPSSMMANLNAYNTYPQSAMMMNRMPMQPQPQVMYHRSPYIPPSTGYYYNYNNAPYTYMEPTYNNAENSAVHMFSDENTGSSCSVM